MSMFIEFDNTWKNQKIEDLYPAHRLSIFFIYKLGHDRPHCSLGRIT